MFVSAEPFLYQAWERTEVDIEEEEAEDDEGGEEEEEATEEATGEEEEVVSNTLVLLLSLLLDQMHLMWAVVIDDPSISLSVSVSVCCTNAAE